MAKDTAPVVNQVGSKELSPEFRKEFLIKIGGAKGKEAILYNGLLALAHADPRFGHIESHIVVYPTAENKFTCYARAEIYDKTGKRIGMEEADANAANCGKMTAASFPRMALTRAKGRAFRDFLNVGMVTSDEIPQVYEPDLASPKQIGKIKVLAKPIMPKKSQLMDFLYNTVGTDQLNDLTEAEADVVIMELQRSAKAEEEMDFSDDE